MATKVRRTAAAEPAFDIASIAEDVAQFALLQDQTKVLGQRMAEIKKRLSVIVEEQGNPDDKGHIWLEFPTPVNGIKALQRQRRVSQSLNEDRAKELLAERGLTEECFVLVPTLDDDAVLAAHFNGKLSEHDIDEIYPKSVSFAFIQVKV